MAIELVQARRVNRVEVERLQSAGLPQINGVVARSSGVAAHAATVDRRRRDSGGGPHAQGCVLSVLSFSALFCVFVLRVGCLQRKSTFRVF